MPYGYEWANHFKTLTETQLRANRDAMEILLIDDLFNRTYHQDFNALREFIIEELDRRQREPDAR